MEPIESAERAEVVGELLAAIGLDSGQVARWWTSRPVELDGRTPATAWLEGDHLLVESLVAGLVEDVGEVTRRLGATTARLSAA